MKGPTLVKKSLVVMLAAASPLLAVPAWAQGSGRNVTILKISGPQLGVRLVEVDKEAVARLKLKEEKGALVTEVMEDSAAEKAGIKRDDVILRYQGESVLTAAQLGRLVADTPEGRKVSIDVVRDGAPVQVTATLERGNLWKQEGEPLIDAEALREKIGKLGELRFKSRERGVPPRMFHFKMDEDGPGWMLKQEGRGRLGITYTEIEGQLAAYFKSPRETAILVNSVVEGSAAEKAGIKAGDLVTSLGGEKVDDGSDLQEAVSDLESGKKTPLTVWRDGKSVELFVTLSDDELHTGKKAPRPRRPVS